jgi:hypothetical protein
MEKNEFSGHILDKSLNIKFHEKPVQWGGRIITFGRVDMTKLMVAFAAN